MPFQLGNKLAKGRTDKPFADALRMELAAAGDNQKALRAIARNLIYLAGGTGTLDGGLAAIMAIADRLDGKPAQESTVNMQRNVSARDVTDEELDVIIAARGSGGEETPPPDPSQLN